jgi:hypothetical protein
MENVKDSKKDIESANEPQKLLTMTEECKKNEYGNFYWDEMNELPKKTDPNVTPKYFETSN